MIAVLDKNGKTLPVSGQDASIAGLQNVLLGKQTATVYKPFSLEAEAASDLAIKILKGEDVGTIDKKLEDGTPYIAVVPVLVGPDDVQQVVDAGLSQPREGNDGVRPCMAQGVAQGAEFVIFGQVFAAIGHQDEKR